MNYAEDPNNPGQSDPDVPQSKTVLGTTLAPLPTPLTLEAAVAEINEALDVIATHTNVAPFISRLLIQRLVKSNPSRAYIRRVATKFESSSGDMKSVVKAILLDPEVFRGQRVIQRRNPLRVDVVTRGTEVSRLREPMIRVTSLIRAMRPTSDFGQNDPLTDMPYMMIDSLDQADFGQFPYKSPSVFNFYLPDYQPPGALIVHRPSRRIPRGTLFAPEFQILTGVTANSLMTRFITWGRFRHILSFPVPTRRSMLKAGAGCGLITNASVMSTLLNLQATKAAVAATGPADYKALVCLFLLGGNDSFNMLVPRNSSSSANPTEYDDYASARGGVDDGTNNLGGLAISNASLIPINNPINQPSRSFGLHPGLGHDASGNQGAAGGVAKLYNDGNLAFPANVGSLIEPTTRTAYNNQSKLPLGLFSHADLTRHWMTANPQTRAQTTGWGGRISDLLKSTNGNPTVSMNISLGGSNLYQTGSAVFPYAISEEGAKEVGAENNFNARQDRIFERHTDSILAQDYSDLLAKSFAQLNRNSIDAAIEFNTQVGSIGIATPFATDDLSLQLKKVAEVIGAADQLGQTRQVFFVSMLGW